MDIPEWEAAKETGEEASGKRRRHQALGRGIKPLRKAKRDNVSGRGGDSRQSCRASLHGAE